jgi:aryl-alcohol dehydrogenase-like predicted oxidoreductase
MGDSDLLANLTYIAWEMDKRNLAFLLVREYQAKDSIGAALKQAFGGGPLAELSLKMDVGVINYDSLAAGFLFGKYRSKPQTDGMARGDKVADYLNDRGLKILSALDTVEADTGARPAEISLAWLMQKKAVTAPIASAKAYPQHESLANYQHDFGPIFSRYFR